MTRTTYVSHGGPRKGHVMFIKQSAPLLKTSHAYYQQYLEGVASGEIVLPEYTTMLGSVVLHYGVFCRVKDCFQAKYLRLDLFSQHHVTFTRSTDLSALVDAVRRRDLFIRKSRDSSGAGERKLREASWIADWISASA
ncbi:hypothetical protein CIRG_06180 [Coccidioides immitis RMSCC 2394]|uniref:Uncharacterized protein n=1 Tax=Coccidioides immitis RMSCC 2394 TaxID=404692 RepID=A0A0J6YHG4_COCIT|nr:hypothetical protein CIRG_06180 [Coccidioides immitis RMSCC 2394]